MPRFAFLENRAIMRAEFSKGAKMTAKAVDYSKYTHEMLFKELDSTSEQIAKLDSQRENLQDKKAQIEQALRQKSEIPTDETKEALLHSHTILKTRNYEDFERLIKSDENA